MKLKPYQLCRWCDGAVHRHRKWAWIGLNALVLALSALLGLLWLILPVLLLSDAALLLFLLHRYHAFGGAASRAFVYQRTPRPKDAQCETVLIDASLIGQGTRLRAAAQPIDVADSVTLRLGSGALLLGAAMVHTADMLPRADRSAILSAVQGLNIKPGRLRSHNPVLRRETAGDVTIVTVRDGMSDRRYYVGSPAEVAKCCASIWEGHTRPMAEQDHARIADTARYIAQANCRVTAWATALEGEEPVFLGMAGVGEEIDLNAMQDVSSLRAMGLTVMLDPGIQPDTDLDALRALLELPDHHARADIHISPRDVGAVPALGVTRRAGDSLLEPITTLRQHFQTIEATLRRFSVMLGVPLAMSLIFGTWPAAIVSAAMLLYAAIALGVNLTAPAPRWQTLAAIGVTALLAKAFLLTQAEPLALMGGGIISAMTAAACAVRLCGPAFTFKGDGWKASLPLLAAAAVYAAIAVAAVLSAGTALLLPLGFSALMAAVIVLFIQLEHMLFR